MNRGMVWFQAFLAALQALIQSMHGQPTHTIVAAARATADESMQHIHPTVFDPEERIPGGLAHTDLPGQPGGGKFQGESDEDYLKRTTNEPEAAGEVENEPEHAAAGGHHGPGAKKKK